MSDQLELFSVGGRSRITLSEAFELLWKYHLKGLPTGRTLMGNRKAICRRLGHLYFHDIPHLEVKSHLESRPAGARFHDHGLLSLVCNQFNRWRRDGFKMEEIDLQTLKIPLLPPTHGIKKGKPGSRSRVVTPKEFSRLAELAPPNLLDIMILRLDTGLRGTDLKRLTTGHLNRFSGEIRLSQSKTGRDISIPVTKRVKAIFDRAKKEGRSFICDFEGIEYWWKKIRKQAGLQDVQMRDLRRSGPSWSYDKFPDFEVMGMLLGHSDPRSTRRYVVIKNKHVKRVTAHIEKEYS